MSISQYIRHNIIVILCLATLLLAFGCKKQQDDVTITPKVYLLSQTISISGSTIDTAVYTYDQDNKLTEVYDKRTTEHDKYTYDSQDRVTDIKIYTDNGNIVGTINQTAHYTYPSATSITQLSSFLNPPPSTLGFTYTLDSKSRLIRADIGATTIAIGYNYYIYTYADNGDIQTINYYDNNTANPVHVIKLTHDTHTPYTQNLKGNLYLSIFGASAHNTISMRHEYYSSGVLINTVKYDYTNDYNADGYLTKSVAAGTNTSNTSTTSTTYYYSYITP